MSEQFGVDMTVLVRDPLQEATVALVTEYIDSNPHIMETYKSLPRSEVEEMYRYELHRLSRTEMTRFLQPGHEDVVDTRPGTYIYIVLDNTSALESVIDPRRCGNPQWAYNYLAFLEKGLQEEGLIRTEHDLEVRYSKTAGRATHCKCGEELDGHEDESGTTCRWCVTGWKAVDENQGYACVGC